MTTMTKDTGSYVDGSTPPGDKPVWDSIEWDPRAIPLADFRFPDGTQYAISKSRAKLWGHVRYWVWRDGAVNKVHTSTSFSDAMAFVTKRAAKHGT